LPVPILVENEHLQIWQLLTALLAFLELKRSHLHIVSILNKHAEKTPQHFNVSLFVNIWVAACHWFFFDNCRANGQYCFKIRFPFFYQFLK
jgi:hypothetical protein